MLMDPELSMQNWNVWGGEVTDDADRRTRPSDEAAETTVAARSSLMIGPPGADAMTIV